MREIDDLVVGTFDITLAQMMENAGRSLAELVIDQYQVSSVTVLVGPGHNGGGGLVAARHLFNRGVEVTVVPARSEGLSATTNRQLMVARAIGVTISDVPVTSSLVIDALLGYSLDGEPRGRVAQLIDWTHDQAGHVVSLDVPSGLDATTGLATRHCVHADATMTLALAKTGLLRAPAITGDLFLADISIPRVAYQIARLDVPDLFAETSIVRLVDDCGSDATIKLV